MKLHKDTIYETTNYNQISINFLVGSKLFTHLIKFDDDYEDISKVPCASVSSSLMYSTICTIPNIS